MFEGYCLVNVVSCPVHTSTHGTTESFLLTFENIKTASGLKKTSSL